MVNHFGLNIKPMKIKPIGFGFVEEKKNPIIWRQNLHLGKT